MKNLQRLLVTTSLVTALASPAAYAADAKSAYEAQKHAVAETAGAVKESGAHAIEAVKESGAHAIEATKAATSNTVDAVKDYSYEKRDALYAWLDEKTAALDSQITSLEDAAKKAKNENKAAFEKAIFALKEKSAGMKQSMRTFRKETQAKWMDTKTATLNAFTELEKDYYRVRKEFS